ncbi:BUD22-domain-containing protein [Syncephalis pseudoplumigaleata]|uniref:BUD22-domain-containing protein n=1 Tax=Syncephalis pseudoplumigaleata TaxID=1712513 RepID=A0A4P9YUN9_9FUNG|nr:BUD22-domain-containing protein [Syncephalis pseudoplumigaleata]|eukprot:RKP23687.1 BUD22-domain-containing protein [Syncephalis pseudoplumigaleata]
MHNAQRLTSIRSKDESIKKREARLHQLNDELLALKALKLDDVATTALDTAIRTHASLASYAVMQRILASTETDQPKARNNGDSSSDNKAKATLEQTKAMKDAVARAVEGVLTTVQFLEGERDHTKREAKKAAKAAKQEKAASRQGDQEATPVASMFMTSLNAHDNNEKEEEEEQEEEQEDWDSDISQPEYSDEEEAEEEKKEEAHGNEEEEEPIIDYDISMSEDEGPSHKKSKVVKKKNRPGQQARRKMNEEKYGRNAHHVRKQMEEERSMRVPRHAPRHDHAKRHAAKPLRSAAPSHQHGSSSSRQPPPKPTVDASSHPSWEAKRRQREQQAAMLRAKPAGTKIVFDDDNE